MRVLKCLFAIALSALAGWTHSAAVPSSSTFKPNSTPQFGVPWRDQEVTAFFTIGEIDLRTGDGNGLFFDVGIGGADAPRIGVLSNGVKYFDYVDKTPAACIPNWPTTGGHTFTFGVRGFNVYLLIDGVQAIDTCMANALNPTGAINYVEYRLPTLNAGRPSIAVTTGSATATFTYFPYTFLYSKGGGNFDPRDFGMRSVAAVTGSMPQRGSTLTLSSPADFRVGDQVIVEIGGEAGRGARNTIGVGGVSPVLHYANAAARDADTSQADNTYAYLGTDGTVWVWSASGYRWIRPVLGGSLYYIGVKVPLSLVAKVTAVDASPATVLTLNTAATVATTNAKVYLDSLPSFYPYTMTPGQMFDTGGDDGLVTFSGMTITVPAGTWVLSNNIVATTVAGNGLRPNFTFAGAGVGSTTLKTPRGLPSHLVNIGSSNSNANVGGFTYIGNLADNGYGFIVSGINHNFGGYPTAIQGGDRASNVTVHDIACVNQFGQCVGIDGVNPRILTATSTVNVVQRDYIGWQLQLADCTGGQIANSTVIGTYLINAFEIFACNGASINNSGGQNAIYSTNSSTSWTIDFKSAQDIVTANSWVNDYSGAIDQALIQVQDNAFGTGSTGLINNPRIIQQGYVDGSNSLKFITISSQQTNVTVRGQFPGSGGCSTTLGGYMFAPNYIPNVREYGAMAVYSDGAKTTVNGIRIVGSAIGPPGHSKHYGNISATGSNSSVTNNVADVVQHGPTKSGNQTNAAYGGC